jgi:hypothetical protein
MEKDYEDYGAYWDQVDDAPAREPLPPEPSAVDAAQEDSSAMAHEFDRAEASPVREVEAQPLPAAKPAEPQSFGEAFKAARAEGKAMFMWNGKRYTTELKKDVKPAPAATPATQPQATQADVRRAEPQARGLNLPKPSMYSRSMMQDIGDAVRARRDEMNARPMFSPKAQ